GLAADAAGGGRAVRGRACRAGSTRAGSAGACRVYAAGVAGDDGAGAARVATAGVVGSPARGGGIRAAGRGIAAGAGCSAVSGASGIVGHETVPRRLPRPQYPQESQGSQVAPILHKSAESSSSAGLHKASAPWLNA